MVFAIKAEVSDPWAENNLVMSSPTRREVASAVRALR
jgi:hypothetical protein